MLKCLVVSDNSGRFDKVSSYASWKRAFFQHPELKSSSFDFGGGTGVSGLASSLANILTQRYDLVVFLQSTFWIYKTWKWPFLRQLTRLKKAAKVFYLVNEYRMLQDQVNAALDLGAGAIVSQMPQDVVTSYYGRIFPGLTLSVPYGLDPEVFRPLTPHDQREVDIGFRGDPYPIYLGHNDRAFLLDGFAARAKDYGFSTDVKVDRSARVSKEEWPVFLNRCRGIIGHEAGTTCLDLDDKSRDFLYAEEARLPKTEFEALKLDLQKRGMFTSKFNGRSLAPRHFDAIGTKTCQILLSGRYNDLLKPDEHYIELKRDMSNIEEVRDKFFDKTFRQKMVDRAYDFALAGHTYKHRVDFLLKQMEGRLN